MLTNYSIKNWVEEDRPREKLIVRGIHSLTNAELFAILLGSGNKEKSAVELGSEILHSVSNDLELFARLSLEDLCKFKGVGEAKAISLLASFELGRRRKIVNQNIPRYIKSSEDAYTIISPLLGDLNMEEFHVIYLNNGNKVLKTVRIAQGGITATVVDARLIFKIAFEIYATALILVHNHPSGQLIPSRADIDLTKRISDFGKLIEINILDHLIVSSNNYLSFADQNML
jgi:DNA repair protein RadC